MATRQKDYLVVIERLGTTYKPMVRLKKFKNLDTLTTWGLREESTKNRLVTIFEITHTLNGVKLKGVY